jgi:predicted TIM-barrel fold metal-dependent hydrolase
MEGWLDVTLAVLRDLSSDEQDAIGWRNAERIYGVRAPD